MNHPERPSRAARAAALLVGLLLCALTAWLFPAPFNAPLDAEIAHAVNEDWDWQLSSWEASRRQVLDGIVPTWAPWISGGVPLLGNPENPALFPGFVLVLAMGSVPAMKILLMLQWWLLVWGAWWAGREIGLSPLAAHFGSLALIASSFLPEFVAWGHQMFLGLCWRPLAWVAQRRGRWALAGAALAMPLLYGAHYVFFFGVVWLVLDAVLRSLDEDRLRWFAPVLIANGLLLTVADGPANAALFWPLAAAFLIAVLLQRPARGLLEPEDALLPLLATGLVAALLIGPKVLAAGELVGVSERLTARLANPALNAGYDLGHAWDVLRGAVDRPAGHEGQNVFFSGFPVAAGLLGLSLAGWRHPRWGLLGLFFWSLGWADATPVNLLEGLNRLPGFDLLGKVERYSLLWTLFLGFGMGHLADRLYARAGRIGAVLMLAGTGVWLVAALPHSRQDIHSVQPAPTATEGEFAQTRGGDLPGFESIQANLGRVDVRIAAPPDRLPEGLLSRDEPGYRGEAYLSDGGPVPVVVMGSRSAVAVPRAGQVVLNQTWYPGWTVDGEATQPWRGLVSAQLTAGPHTFRYWPPGLGPALALAALTWLGIGVALVRAWRRR